LALGVSLLQPIRAGAQASEATIASVVSQWQTPPSSADSLQSLVLESASLRDSRVLAAALGAVQSQISPQQVRVAGLRVLLTFATGSAGSVSSPQEITDPDSAQPVAAIPSIAGNAGAQPVTTATLGSLISALQAISANDPDNGVRTAAARVRRYAEYTTAPKPTLTYVCRTRFRIRSTSTLDTFVEYSVSGTSEVGRIAVAHREPNASYADTFFATDGYGTVTIFSLPGELIASAANGRTACPT
jgi:hypothetical protein